MTRTGKRFGILLVLMLLVCLADAREFWIRSPKFFFNPGESLTLSFAEGDDFIANAWEPQKGEIEKLEHYTVTGVTNLLKDGQLLSTVTLTGEGTHMLAAQRTTVEDQPVEKLAAALKAYELTPITVTGSLKVLETRSMKMLVQAGEKRDGTALKTTGAVLEIVPLKNPYTLKIGDAMRFKILWQGKPAFGMRIKVWNRKDNRTTLQNIYTEKDGTIETPVSNTGAWMVSAANMVQTKDSRATWQRYQSSLSFGF